MHILETVPLFAKHRTGTYWNTAAQTKYVQYTCSGGYFKKNIWTYCIFNPGIRMRQDQWMKHFANAILEVEKE